LRSRVLIGAAVVVAAVATGVAPAGASADSIGLRLLDVPATSHLDPRARIYIVDHLAPGTVVHRRIQVSNTAASIVPVAMYAAAATIRKGTFLGGADHARNELSTWSSVKPGVSKVPGHKRVTAVVTIAVPRDAAPGERYGVVWAEARSAPSGGRGITEVSRVGIRVYLSVGPGGPPAANFTIRSVVAKRSRDGRPMVLASVRNTGGRALDVSGTLHLRAGPGGLSAGPFPANLGVTLAIGDTEPVTIVLDNRLPSGPWNAQVTLHSGLVQRTTHATITFPGSKRSSSPKALIAAVVALLLLLGTSALLLRRRSRHDKIFNAPSRTAPV
jgi:hypothetical protein